MLYRPQCLVRAPEVFTPPAVNMVFANEGRQGVGRTTAIHSTAIRDRITASPSSESPGMGYYTDARKRSSVSRILPNLGRCNFLVRGSVHLLFESGAS